jgi:hypothetical protein
LEQVVLAVQMAQQILVSERVVVVVRAVIMVVVVVELQIVVEPLVVEMVHQVLSELFGDMVELSHQQ